MNSIDYLEAFLDSMSRRDVDGAVAHLADSVVLHSPIVSSQFEGKEKVGSVLKHLLDVVDQFTPKLLLRDGANVVAVLTITVGEDVIDAFDHIHLGDDGRIESMMVAWRPLPALVAVQQLLVPRLGGQAQELVPLDRSRCS